MPDTPLIPPALTPEQWTKALAPSLYTSHESDGERLVRWAMDEVIDDTDRHGLAALCLHDQPFGFTRAHLDALSLLIDHGERFACEHPFRIPRDIWAKLTLAREAQARVSALLPPDSP